MPEKEAPKLSKRTVDALFVEGKDTVFWDRDLTGFVMFDFMPLI